MPGRPLATLFGVLILQAFYPVPLRPYGLFQNYLMGDKVYWLAKRTHPWWRALFASLPFLLRRFFLHDVASWVTKGEV